jgi:hypothetical protein
MHRGQNMILMLTVLKSYLVITPKRDFQTTHCGCCGSTTFIAIVDGHLEICTSECSMRGGLLLTMRLSCRGDG